MKRADIEDKIKLILADVLLLEKSSVDLSLNLQALGVDSLDIIELITRVEQEFQIGLPKDIYKRIKTGTDIVTFLEGRVKVS